MAERLGLLRLLGVTTIVDAAARWPRSTFLPGLGIGAEGDDTSDYEPLLQYLDEVLSFVSVRPGAAADKVGLYAEVVIAPHPTPHPLVLRRLPDFGFVLQANTPAAPARVFVTQGDTGVEVVVEGLPVEIHLPNGLLGPLRTEEEEKAGPAFVDVTQAGPFEPGTYDTFEVVLSEQRSSVLKVHLRVRFTEEREVVIEPAVPVSVGACRFSGLPCVGVHDLGFLPYPRLSGDHTEHEIALEWARHEIHGGLGIDGTGLVTVRTLDLDHTRDPLKGIKERIEDPVAAADVEFVLEDLALPVSSWLTPVATHGRFGLRRAVLQAGDDAEPYDLTLAPIDMSLAAVVDWRLRIFRVLFETPDTLVARLAVLFGNDDSDDHAMVIDVTDGWLLQGAWLPPLPVHLFTVANARVSLMTAKLGILLRDLQEAQGAQGWLDHVRGLLDFGVAVGDDEDLLVKLRVPTRPPGAPLGQDVVLRDIGWDLGALKVVPSLWFPEDVTLTAFEVVQLEVEELTFLNEDNGGRYLALSGGVSIFPGAAQPKREARDPVTPGVPAEGQPDGGGLRFRRLRLRTGGNDLAPTWLLDGISLFVKVGRFQLSGSGTITDVTRDGHRYREFGLGLQLAFRALGYDFSLGAQLFYGRVTGAVDNFTYWLFGFQIGYLPVGSFALRGGSLLVAGGMQPDLPEPSGRPQEMRLLDWYKQHRAAGAVEVRSDRNQQRGGWKVERGAEAAGLGADIVLSVSKTVVLRAFVFVHRSASSNGVLVAAEVFAMKNPEPIGIGAVELDLDRDKWGAIIGVDLDFVKLLGTDSDNPLAKGLGRLTGTVYAGNQPAMFAIGQLADQASWLTFSINDSLFGARARISLGFCLQISADPGPSGFGFVATAVAEGKFGIGKVQFYAAFGVVVGTWGNEASSSGLIAWAELALRIKVFYVFSFGANVKAVIESLGPQEPHYRRTSLEVRIETPWWLPDVTFRVERVSEIPAPGSMPVVSMPLRTASAREPGLTVETPVAVTTLGDPDAVRPIDELRALPSDPVAESVWATLVPVSVDSTIALDFNTSLDNATTVVPTTAADTGLQAPTAPAKNDLSARYTLVQVGIRRRPRYGEQAGVWTDVLAPEDTEVAGLDDLMGDPDLSVTFSSAVRFRWDADVTKGNALDPRRLLVNADTPYSFVSGGASTDEGLLATDPSYPCCSARRTSPAHRLDFTGTPLGVRAPTTQKFTDAESTLRWLLARPPVVAASLGQPAGTHVARVLLFSSTDLTLAVVTFDQPAFTFDLSVFWEPVRVADLDSALVVEASRGLTVVDRQVFPLSGPSPAVPVHCQDAQGLTSVTIRYRRREHGVGTTDPAGEWVEVRQLRYRTVQEQRDLIAEQARCQAHGSAAGGGKLAWLPNHDYELTLGVRTTVDYQGSAQEAVVVQRAGFRTRGLPGLNAVEATGQELEPYVESVYPGATPRLLYRAEPVVVAFDDRFSSLLPIGTTPVPGALPEQTQLLEWVLAVSQADGSRLSVTSPDWVVTNRGTVPPPSRWPRVIDDVLVTAAVRSAPSLSPFRQRLELLAQASPSCGSGVALQASQVLSHDPVDPTGETDDVLWPGRTTLRVAVRRKRGPFVSREPFEGDDVTALTAADEGRLTATGWRFADGAVAVAGSPSAGVRHYAVLGEADWNHVQARTLVDPAGGAAGVAVAVAGLPRVQHALVALVDESAGQLRIIARRGGVTTDLASAPLPPGAAPYSLEVLAYDDRLRARVGETVVEAERLDLRDGRLALVADGPGTFASLHVDGLEAYVSQLATSRFSGFAEHVRSWDGLVHPLPADAAGVAGLLSATGAQIPTVMAAADSQLRQRLFDRWTADLALPLSPAVDGVRLAALGASGGTHLLLLESPEPLPFSRDVRLQVTHRVTSFPAGAQPGIPRRWLAFAAGLTFTRTTVRGAVPSSIVPVVRRARHLVRAVPGDRLGRRVRYEVYAVEVTVTPRGALLEGELTEVRPASPLSPTRPRPRALPVDSVALLDRSGRLLGHVLPLPVEQDVPVELAVLTNGAEDKALLVPTSPMGPDDYAFRFDLDRVRYRSATVDDTTNYRDSATLSLVL